MQQKDYTFEIGFYESVLGRLPEDFGTIEALGHLYTQTGQLERGLDMDRRAVKLRPENALVQYNLACSLSLTNRLDEAMDTLKHAVELGYDDLKWMIEDPDLEALRELPEFHALIKQVRMKKFI